MKLAFLNSNIIDISSNTSKGTEIFCYMLIRNLLRNRASRHISITAFASGNSKLPVPTISVTDYDLMSKSYIPSTEYYKFEQLLISKALSMQKSFDLYHFNMGNGELIIPFAPFIRKPVIITLHGSFSPELLREYFSKVERSSKMYFVAISEAQRRSMPNLNYIATIYHGVDTVRNFRFSPTGGKSIMWAGRAVPEKGLDATIQVIKRAKKPINLYLLPKQDYLEWLHSKILSQIHNLNKFAEVNVEFNLSRRELSPKYKESKLFLFPIQWEEPFGLVMVESLACGTPVVAYARGSVPEVIKDGLTGFVVNPSDEDIRGDFIIKKTGIQGLVEAIERIYAMSDEEYRILRHNCRAHAVENFDVKNMIKSYIKIYRQVTK